MMTNLLPGCCSGYMIHSLGKQYTELFPEYSKRLKTSLEELLGKRPEIVTAITLQSNSYAKKALTNLGFKSSPWSGHSRYKKGNKMRLWWYIPTENDRNSTHWTGLRDV